MYIIGLTGYKGSGKEEFVKLEEKILKSAKIRKLTINPTPAEVTQAATGEGTKTKAASKKLKQP